MSTNICMEIPGIFGEEEHKKEKFTWDARANSNLDDRKTTQKRKIRSNRKGRKRNLSSLLVVAIQATWQGLARQRVKSIEPQYKAPRWSKVH